MNLVSEKRNILLFLCLIVFCDKDNYFMTKHIFYNYFENILNINSVQTHFWNQSQKVEVNKTKMYFLVRSNLSIPMSASISPALYLSHMHIAHAHTHFAHTHTHFAHAHPYFTSTCPSEMAFFRSIPSLTLFSSPSNKTSFLGRQKIFSSFFSFTVPLSLLLSLSLSHSLTHSQYLFPSHPHTQTLTHILSLLCLSHSLSLCFSLSLSHAHAYTFWTIWKKSDTDFMFVSMIGFHSRYSIHILIIGYSIEEEMHMSRNLILFRFMIREQKFSFL